MRVPRAWKIAVVAVVVCLGLAMSAVLGAVAVQRRALAAPRFAVALGSARVAGFTTTTPNCRNPARSGLNCASWSINSNDEYFTVWLMVRTRRGAVLYEQAERLFVMRLGERPRGRN